MLCRRDSIQQLGVQLAVVKVVKERQKKGFWGCVPIGNGVSYRTVRMRYRGWGPLGFPARSLAGSTGDGNRYDKPQSLLAVALSVFNGNNYTVIFIFISIICFTLSTNPDAYGTLYTCRCSLLLIFFELRSTTESTEY